MVTPSAQNKQWSSYAGFILACIGAAVGLGNVWKFPYMVGTNGGSAFVLIYLMTIFAIAIPIAAAELLLGRMGQAGSIASLRNLVGKDKPQLRAFAILPGGVGVLASYVLLSFYAVIAGWVMAYILFAVNGTLVGVDADGSAAVFNLVLGNAEMMIVFQFLFLAFIALILYRGIGGGLEKANLFLMPALFIMLILIAVYGVIGGDAKASLTYLFTPDFGKINAQTILAAVGQGFFSVGVGAAMLITYGAFMDREINIGYAAITIGLADTLIACLAGFGIFAIVFGQGLDPAGGPGLIFTTLPIAFAQLSGGMILAFIFFTLVFFAALTSGLALAEVVISALETSFGVHRTTAILLTLGSCFVIGLATVFSFNHWAEVKVFGKTLFDAKDYLAANILMPLSGLLVILFACWALPVEKIRASFGGSAIMFTSWLWLGRIISPLGIIWVFWENL